jgi:hypothetical protein
VACGLRDESVQSQHLAQCQLLRVLGAEHLSLEPLQLMLQGLDGGGERLHQSDELYPCR